MTEKVYGKPVALDKSTAYISNTVTRYKQARPYNLPLPYQRSKRTMKHAEPRNTAERHHSPLHRPDIFHNATGRVETITSSNRNARNGISNKALAKVDDELAFMNNFFEDIYERQQSLNMVASAAKQLLKFATNWKNPRYWKSLKTGVTTPRSYPEAWLAYNFGVKPLIGSIDTALNTLGKEFPRQRVSGTSGGTLTYNIIGGQYYSSAFATASVLITIGCQVTGNPNPNRALANMVGLTTPFSTAMSVVPWGWAVDYFVNVSQLLSNFENKHPGVVTSGWYRTEVDRVSVHGLMSQPIYWKDKVSYTENFFEMHRTLQGSGYKPHLSFPLLGSGKAANLLSALAVSMKQKR